LIVSFEMKRVRYLDDIAMFLDEKILLALKGTLAR